MQRYHLCKAMTNPLRFKPLLIGFFLLLTGLVIWGVISVRSQWGERLSRNDVVIDRELPSPDGSKFLVSYRFDSGALGYTAERNTVVPANQLHGDLQHLILPKRYDPIGWEKDQSLAVKTNIVECLRNHEDCSHTYDTFAGTGIRIRREDETQDKEREIEADLPSPDRQLRLVAYRYPSDDRSNLGRIHISILRTGEPIPQYGNYYIASMGGDGVLGARWDSDGSLVLVTSPSQNYLMQYVDSFMVDRPTISYRVEVDDRLPGYLWVKGAAITRKR
jgi:hypothetical protein